MAPGRCDLAGVVSYAVTAFHSVQVLQAKMDLLDNLQPSGGERDGKLKRMLSEDETTLKQSTYRLSCCAGQPRSS